MSAWLIFASLGFYPLPSESYYILGSPVVHSARIYRKMTGGKLLAFNINVQNNHVNKHKVDTISLNGIQTDNFINFDELKVQNSMLNFNFPL
jgi:putative alpha-1,2-mannosidase